MPNYAIIPANSDGKIMKTLKLNKILALSLIISCTYAGLVQAKVNPKKISRLKECKVLEEGYFKYVNKSVSIECNEDYHHFKSKSYKKSKSNKVKLATFNIYKINHHLILNHLL